MKHAHLQVMLWEAADKRASPDKAADNSKFVWEVWRGVVFPAIHIGSAAPPQVMRELLCGCRSEQACVRGACVCQAIKTHHYIIYFVRPLHSKPEMESFC